jgi:hypothetical protein
MAKRGEVEGTNEVTAEVRDVHVHGVSSYVPAVSFAKEDGDETVYDVITVSVKVAILGDDFDRAQVAEDIVARIKG